MKNGDFFLALYAFILLSTVFFMVIGPFVLKTLLDKETREIGWRLHKSIILLFVLYVLAILACLIF